MLTISVLIMSGSFLMSVSQWVGSAQCATVKAEPEPFPFYPFLSQHELTQTSS